MNRQMAETKTDIFGQSQGCHFKVRPSSCSGQEEASDDDDDDDDSAFGKIVLFVYHGFCTGGTNFSRHRRKAIELALQQHLRIFLSAWMTPFLPSAHQNLDTETKDVFFPRETMTSLNFLPSPVGRNNCF